ncbi:MAG: LPS export ABC transporter periplasmic protein LptC [Pseudomonadota bacterium]
MTQISHAVAPPMPSAPIGPGGDRQPDVSAKNTLSPTTPAPAAQQVSAANAQTHNATPAGSRSAARGERDHITARNHSRLVKTLKWTLPMLVVGTIGMFGASIAMNLVPNVEVTMDSSLIEDGRVVMKNPRMKGVDKQNRAFEVIATRAITDLANPAEVELEGIDAKVPVNATTFADVKADQGFYNNTEEVLLLRNNVRMSGARGMDISMEDARINMKDGTLASDKPVEVTSQQADISANAISVEDNGARIVFTERVRMTIKQPVARGQEPSETGNEPGTATPITQLRPALANPTVSQNEATQ